MQIVRELVGELTAELSQHRRPVLVVAVPVLLLLLAGAIAAAVGSEVAVAAIASVGILGTAVAVLVFTARSSSS